MDWNAAVWRKSSWSGSDGGSCVEVATGRTGLMGVRDSKIPGGPVVVVVAEGWRAFVAAVKSEIV
ncbi:hypothetical protein Sme01_74410 [Sphaerisporangium melleum]|uniref:DUF397 domain-containing protein n=1 Tax=Sphaerisporangium melleum TaxID=321316 RepID=A0A917RRS6_9ACTN|nr:DUF397 domain-containing protein [Sphaerisporangium melleum]GGL21181.1 hypothetical protein GCM10007964_73900 [Sphaerisporangium melleum]GII74965.1 hypothetical protein Sme01_74410 [Sphaerisporangium melleum]